jgi:peroxiredoxin Q/BCP
VSKDTPEDQKAFADKIGVQFPLIPDADGKIIGLYGVGGPRGYAHRITFVIGPDGKIFKVFTDVDPENHEGEVMKAVKNSMGMD